LIINKAFAKGTSTFCESSIGTEQLHARAIAFIDASPFAPPGGFGHVLELANTESSSHLFASASAFGMMNSKDWKLKPWQSIIASEVIE